MAAGAALRAGEVLPREPMRLWLLSVPFALKGTLGFITHLLQLALKRRALITAPYAGLRNGRETRCKSEQ
jgi:hypothetical protein